MDRKEFLKAIFAYGTALAVAPSIALTNRELIHQNQNFGFTIRKPKDWISLQLPRFERLSALQRAELSDCTWFDWVRQQSGLPVLILAENDTPWERPTGMVSVYANPLPDDPDANLDQVLDGAPALFTKAFPESTVLEETKFRSFGSTRGAEFAIQYRMLGQSVRSRAVMAWGSKFEICLSLEDYPEHGCDTTGEFNEILNKLIIS